MASPLVLAGPLGAPTAVFAPIVEALSASFVLVPHEHPGHGGTASPPGDFTFDMLAERVLAELDQRGITRASYCGVGFGGMVGLWLALHSPDRIDRLAVVCSSASPGNAEAWRERAAMVRHDGLDSIADATVARWTTPVFARSTPGTVDELRAMLLTTRADAYAGCCEAVAGFDAAEGLGAVAAPTVAIAATADTGVPPDHSQRIHAGIPGSAYVEVRGAHVPFVEYPLDLTAALLTHLAPRPETQRDLACPNGRAG